MPAERKRLPPLMKLALEMGPLVTFFIANAKAGIFTATAVFMVAMAISLIVTWLMVRRLPTMPLVSGAMVLVFGSLTLVLHDDLFIKVKPTIQNALFGGALLLGLALGKNLLDIAFDGVFRLTAVGWRLLTVRWALFFFVLAGLNEIVWRFFPEKTWVDFKVWGVMPITLVFAMAQVPLLTRHALPEGAEPAEEHL